MSSSIKNTILFVVVALALFALYFFFLKPEPEEETLVSTVSEFPVSFSDSSNDVLDQNSSTNRDFLSILLNVRGIKINDAIFSDPAFIILKDSTIKILPTEDEGRPNPFAPIGREFSSPPASSGGQSSSTSPSTTTTTTTSTTTNPNSSSSSPDTSTPPPDTSVPPPSTSGGESSVNQ